MSPTALTVGVLLRMYGRGFFPMAHDDGGLYWHDPDPRAIIPLEGSGPNARLRSYIRSHGYTCTLNSRFEEVMRACADRPERWINEEMIIAYTELHRAGFAISAETWLQDELIGGIYGVAIGRAFFGESMFSRKSNASKAAFHHLVAHLRDRGFILFDTQYINPHTRSLGAIEVSRAAFKRMLMAALDAPRDHLASAGQ